MRRAASAPACPLLQAGAFFCRTSKTIARFCRKCVRTTKTPRVFAEFALGQPKRRRVLLPQHKSDLHPKRFSLPNAILLKTQTGAVPPTQKCVPPKKVFPAQHDFAENPNGCCFPNAKATFTQKSFPRPDTILPKTEVRGLGVQPQAVLGKGEGLGEGKPRFGSRGFSLSQIKFPLPSGKNP